MDLMKDHLFLNCLFVLEYTKGGASAQTPPTSAMQMPEVHDHDDKCGEVMEKIEGLIRVYKDGRVERPQVVPCVGPSWYAELRVASSDIVIDRKTNIWARAYVPSSGAPKLPLIVYFHGGGFCVGSASWACYDGFLARLSAKSRCLIMSVDYRLAPENPLPAAYEDGFQSLLWLRQQSLLLSEGRSRDATPWMKQCDFTRIFLAGDSAGGNIAHNMAVRLNSVNGAILNSPMAIRGIVLIQPFFGGEARTQSERLLKQPPGSALSLEASDTYWRLALPRGSTRDHEYSDPMAMAVTSYLPDMLLCVAEMDILRDRILGFCGALERRGTRVERAVYAGVGHAFQILGKSQLAKARTYEMMRRIRDFIRGL